MLHWCPTIGSHVIGRKGLVAKIIYLLDEGLASRMSCTELELALKPINSCREKLALSYSREIANAPMDSDPD